MEYSKDIIREKYKAATEDLQKAIDSDKRAAAIYLLALKHGLTKEGHGELSRTATLAMLGMIAKDDMSAIFEQKMRLPKEKSDALLKDFTDQVVDKWHTFVFGDMTDEELNEIYKEPLRDPNAPQNEKERTAQELSFLDEKLNNVVRNAPDALIAAGQADRTAPDNASGPKQAETVKTAEPPRYASGADPYREQI